MVWIGGFLSSLNKTAVNKGFPVFVAPVRDGFGVSNACDPQKLHHASGRDPFHLRE
jgi:hypothetical protein